MFAFLRKNLIKARFFQGYTDYHCHILPGVDDGIQDMESALKTLDYYEELGMEALVFTPHVMEGKYSDIDRLETRFEELKAAYKGSLKLKLAAEYMLDAGFAAQMQRGLKCIQGNVVLVETSYFAPPVNLEKMLLDITEAGLTPLIAHPERYAYMSIPMFKSLKAHHYLLQLDLMSLAKHYGTEAQRNAFYLLRAGMYDLVGSDLHRLGSFKHGINSIRLARNDYSKLLALKSLCDENDR